MPTAGNYLPWITITHTVPQIGFSASIGLGLVVVFLNFCGAQNKFGPYKYILNSFTILGVIFSIVEVVVYPESAFVVVASYTFFYAATVALLATQFIYRYWAIFEQSRATVHCSVPTTSAQVALQQDPLDGQSNVERLSDTQSVIQIFSEDL
ncbi:Protein CBG01347 [Caenorhabditis briggsae]|uniref:Protein CBG01347 n=1 Tax=Caenorhabditis briggsae TaxID=6238 RepID=A8WQ72_CAEBR|nr:Protein CBG01347 [Caenorhabditis briggsae]CAP22630.2 Protein CBG01347 [Caenorhabditis briggsae]